MSRLSFFNFTMDEKNEFFKSIKKFNESASAQELSATSQELVANSNILGNKADESMANLSELS